MKQKKMVKSLVFDEHRFDGLKEQVMAIKTWDVNLYHNDWIDWQEVNKLLQFLCYKKFNIRVDEDKLENLRHLMWVVRAGERYKVDIQGVIDCIHCYEDFVKYTIHDFEDFNIYN